MRYTRMNLVWPTTLVLAQWNLKKYIEASYVMTCGNQYLKNFRLGLVSWNFSFMHWNIVFLWVMENEIMQSNHWKIKIKNSPHVWIQYGDIEFVFFFLNYFIFRWMHIFENCWILKLSKLKYFFNLKFWFNNLKILIKISMFISLNLSTVS